MIGMKNTMGLMLLMVVGLTQAAPQISTNQVVSTVTTQLQPLIAKAVADALASSSSSFQSRPTTFSAPRPSIVYSEPYTTEEPTAPAAYQYSYKVADDEAQTYLNKDETRDGDNVQGTYSYVDATGGLVTVTYTAGPDGYNEQREVQKGFVTMRNIPGAWTGPLAGVDDVSTAVVPARVQPVDRVDQSGPVDQSPLIQLIISQLQPSISSAVQSAISSRQAALAASSFSSENSVRISTPEFNIEY